MVIFVASLILCMTGSLVDVFAITELTRSTYTQYLRVRVLTHRQRNNAYVAVVQ